MDDEEPMNIIHMPYLAMEKIFSFLSFDEVARCRIVCTTFNSIAGQSLNRGFYASEQYHKKLMKNVKSLLPRRESERRAHPLSKKSDILQAIETRLSMLSMTFSKYIETSSCCFIPGKVIDEIYRVLRIVNNSRDITEKGHELLQELRDISSMAMEHFDEKIVPYIKSKLEAKRRYEFSSTFQGVQITKHQSMFHSLYVKTNKEVGVLRKAVFQQQNRISKLVKDNILFKKRTKKYVSLFKKSQNQIRSLLKTVGHLRRQNETSTKMSKSFDEEKQRITDMVKRVETCENKITEMLTEVPSINFNESHYGLKCSKQLNLSPLREDSEEETSEPRKKRFKLEQKINEDKLKKNDSQIKI